MNDLASVCENLLAKLDNGTEQEIIEILNSEITDESGEKSLLLHHDLHDLEVFNGNEWDYLMRFLNKGYTRVVEVISGNLSEHDVEISVLGNIYGAHDGLDFNENSYTSFHMADEHGAMCCVKKVGFPHLAIRERDGEVIVEIDRKAVDFQGQGGLRGVGMSEFPEITESEFGDFTKDATKVSVVSVLGV